MNKILFISPHFDDCCYSCHTSITQLASTNEITLCNVFTQSIWCPRLPLKDVQSISNQRAEEDDSYFKYIGIFERVNLSFPDCTLRNRETFQTPILESERGLVTNVEAQLAMVVESHHDALIFVPLAIGNHIDHYIIFQFFMNRISSLKDRLVFYEDLPYSNFFSRKSIDTLIRKKLEDRCKASLVRMSFSQLKNKVRGMLIYKSQTRLFDVFHVLWYTIFRRRMSERLWKTY